jgi:hypothetical protein
MTVLRGEVFGRTNFSRLAGLMDPISTVGVVVAPVFAGLAFDLQGTYDGAFIVLAALSTIAALLLFGIRIPQLGESPTDDNKDGALIPSQAPGDTQGLS